MEDGGLRFADAVYEVFEISNAVPRDEEEHLDRLESSLTGIRMAMPMRRSPLKLVVRETIRRNRIRSGLLYLQVRRGAEQHSRSIPAVWKVHLLILVARVVDLRAMENAE